ncbi:hypothetical protein ANN_14336 [Periplaneta americana]|uniref:Uncharacterized protein n=1 Tax=Periplaneta americana TaxID=6978 RepID=A0ABQ8SXD3_PERAM|nr:hypothetical protein ANN_14336 [Periplaneta americana]
MAERCLLSPGSHTEGGPVYSVGSAPGDIKAIEGQRSPTCVPPLRVTPSGLGRRRTDGRTDGQARNRQ